MNKTYFISQSESLTVVVLISLIFTFVGLKSYAENKGLNNYLTANRNIGLFSLTTSLSASALGAWILFGPVSAASWGGLGAVIGYSLGTAFPMFFFIFLGKKIRNEFPKGSSLIEFMRKKFGKSLFKLILLMTVFYMFIFLCAEITAIAILINYISGTELWITAFVVLLSTLIYTLRGGLRASILTDNIQMIITAIILVLFLIQINFSLETKFSFDFIKKNNPNLISSSYITGYTAGLTFFIAVAATNLFHQGNWQRIYAAKNYNILKKSLIISFLIILPIVFLMGFIGLVSFSIDPSIRPDLGFFSLLLKDQSKFLSLVVIILGLCLTISTLDTLINAISSLIIIDGKSFFNLKGKKDYLNISKFLIIFLSIISFIIASKGFDILYLFLLADLFCCAFVLTVFLSFFDKKIDEKTAYQAIILGLIGGFLLFPNPDFSKSLLVGTFFSSELFAPFITQSLLFLSFVIATFFPLVFLKLKSLI
tara:strand:- start:121 stop:1566 length:1446 start_codon:yes stop_codon:yes gene_type:complete